MKLLKLLYYYFAEYDLDKAMKKVERDLLKLKSRIMSGDRQAEQLAWVTLNEYDKLKIEFERRHFVCEEMFNIASNIIIAATELAKQK